EGLTDEELRQQSMPPSTLSLLGLVRHMAEVEYAPADPWPAEVRNLLTYVLIRLERWQDALDQLRLIGPYATSFPWDRVSDDPLGQFLELRDGVRLEVASIIPLHPRSERGGRARSGDH
ncbi:DUF664 domain-containing protein, partial [Streptomyces mirabilis]|uniref:mycothiol transferase n=1 Tax=Streptomyces mirabilis TaxID=68239 RepID=UPI0033D613FD